MLPANLEIARFVKMVHFGVPPQAVKLKMSAEGYDPSLLEFVMILVSLQL